MRRTRFAVVVAGCLLTLLGLLYPLSFRMREILGSIPWPTSLFDVLKYQHDEHDPVTIAWFAMAAEFSLINLLTGVFYVATYMRKRESFVYTGLAAFSPILIACGALLYARKFGTGILYSSVPLWTEGYLLLALVAGLYLVRVRRKDRFAESLPPVKERTKPAIRSNTLLFQRSYSGNILIGLWLLPAACLLVRGVQSRQEAARIAAAPHLKAEDLVADYAHEPVITGKRYNHKFIVVTGMVNGMDAGLIGDGVLYMDGIDCDVEGQFGSCGGGETCTVAGTCEGKNEDGKIIVSNGRTLP